MYTKVKLRYKGQVKEVFCEVQKTWRDTVLALPSDYVAARTVAIKRDGGLGDIVMLTAAIHRLVELYPHLAVDVYTSEAFIPLLKTDPYIMDVRPMNELNKWAYDIVLNCVGLVERSRHDTTIDRVTLFSMKICGEPPSEGPLVFLPPYETVAEAVQPLLEMQEYRVGIAPWAARVHNDWPHTQALVDTLRANGITPYLIHNNAQRMATIEGAIPVTLDLISLAHFLGHLNVLVAVDSGVLHLAAANGYKQPYIIGLFGMVHPRLRIRWYHNIVGLADESLQCFPCNMAPQCSLPSPCMVNLRPQQIAPMILQRRARY